MFKKPYVIAEVGSNHLGNMRLCFNSIIQAKNAGANCVKFQLFDENNLVNQKMKIYKHVKDKKLKFQFQRFKKVKISMDQVKKLYEMSKQCKIDFCVTPFDASYVNQLKKYVKFFKVASGDLNNFELLRAISKTKKKVVLSTGMSNYKEIENAINHFSKKDVTLLHCISCYPTKNKDANLINIKILKEKFNLNVGYSDHTEGIEVASNSIFFGATIIEKHFMPKKTKLAGDFKLSVDQSELKKLVFKINENFKTIGQKRKGAFGCEKYYKKTLRRSVYYSQNIQKLQKLSRNHLNFLRPYSKSGIKIEEIKKYLGSKIKVKVKNNQLVKKNHFLR